MKSQKDLELELQQKLHETLSKNTSNRPDNVPFCVEYEGHTFKFVKYLKKAKMFKYECENGYNHHLKIENRCPACINVSLLITQNSIDNIPVIIINGQHTCTKETKSIQQSIKDAELIKLIEEIYYSKTPRPTRADLNYLLLQKIKPPIPEGLINNHYTRLEKENKKIDKDFTEVVKTKKGLRLELFKTRFFMNNPPVPKIIICYCSDLQKSKIAQSRFIFIDGTFGITPQGFSQVLVIMGQTPFLNYPLAYMLLPAKAQEVYERAFTYFKIETKANFQSGATFITDFEWAERNAVKKIFMNNTHFFQYCYFHFTQILKRYFDKYPKSEYLNKLRYIANLLPFIPYAMVTYAINEMYKYDVTRQFAEYFEKDFMVTYEFDDWNCSNKTDDQTITNNAVESHNRVLKDKIGNDPSFEEFVTGIKEVEDYYSTISDTRTLIPSEIKRIDPCSFKQIFKKFITNIKRGFIDDEPEIVNDSNNPISVSDSYFIDESDENSDTFPNSILSPSKENEDIEEIPEIHEEQDSLNDINDKIEEIEKSDLFKKASSRTTSNIRGLPNEVIEILKENMVLFNNAAPRSTERNLILTSTLAKVSEIDKTIT